MKSVRVTIGVIILLMSLMFFSCTSSSGKRVAQASKPAVVDRVVKFIGESHVNARTLDSSYHMGDTVRILYNTTGMSSRLALAVVVR